MTHSTLTPPLSKLRWERTYSARWKRSFGEEDMIRLSGTGATVAQPAEPGALARS